MTTPTPTNGDTQTCPTCGGTGKVTCHKPFELNGNIINDCGLSEPCDDCNGTGRIPAEQSEPTQTEAKEPCSYHGKWSSACAECWIADARATSPDSHPTPTSGELEAGLDPFYNREPMMDKETGKQWDGDNDYEQAWKSNLQALIAREKSEYAVKKVRDLEQTLLQEKFEVDLELPEGPFDVVPADVIKGQIDDAIKHEQEKVSRG